MRKYLFTTGLFLAVMVSCQTTRPKQVAISQVVSIDKKKDPFLQCVSFEQIQPMFYGTWIFDKVTPFDPSRVPIFPLMKIEKIKENDRKRLESIILQVSETKVRAILPGMDYEREPFWFFEGCFSQDAVEGSGAYPLFYSTFEKLELPPRIHKVYMVNIAGNLIVTLMGEDHMTTTSPRIMWEKGYYLHFKRVAP